jgi:hypothetical protein
MKQRQVSVNVDSKQQQKINNILRIQIKNVEYEMCDYTG